MGTIQTSKIASIVSNSNPTLVFTVTTGDGTKFSVGKYITLTPPNTEPSITNSMTVKITGKSTDQLTVDYSTANRQGTPVLTPLTTWQVQQTNFLNMYVSQGTTYTDLYN